MAKFSDLPLEMLPYLLQFIVKPQHLAACCLVDHAFYTFAVSRLYERTFIFAWHREAKIKVTLLFRTLAECPHLARYVQKIEIRDFPKSLTADRQQELLNLCLRGLENSVNLKSCTWTRDGSIDSAILKALQGCSQLRELEINGHDSGYYNPHLLTEFSNLSKISLIMPGAPVLDILPSWIGVTGRTLRNLTLICKASSIVNDTLLETLASGLVGLEHLYIIGCPKVTEKGAAALVTTNSRGLLGLGLEGVSPLFDMATFNRACSRTQALRRLQAITLTIDLHTRLRDWMQDAADLLSIAPLESFQMYCTSALIETTDLDDFWTNIITAHGARLKLFSIHRMRISTNAIREICAKCPALEQLFVVAERYELESLGRCLSQAANLRVVHINFPLEIHAYFTTPVLFPQDVLSVIRQCPPTLMQFGCNTRVWQVQREITVDEGGRTRTEPKLYPYESPDIPEPFLVVRA